MPFPHSWFLTCQLLMGSLLVSLSAAHAADDEIPLEEEEKELEQIEKAEPSGDDLLGGEGAEVGGAGRDTEKIYRAQLAAVKGMGPDEELEAWEKYLEEYSKSSYRDRIVERMTVLESGLYGERIGGGEGERDQDSQEILLAQGLELDSLNPRTRLQFGFAYGLPSYGNFYVDYEHQLKRNLSVHGGVRRRFTGPRLELGTRYAFIKSTRTQTVVGLIGDIAFNMQPAYPVIRPQIGVGKKFGTKFDAQMQVGIEVDPRKNAALREIGGVNFTYRAAPTVGVFAESSFYMQNLATDKGSLLYRFNTLNFGLKFYPKFKGTDPNDVEMAIGAVAPYTSNYWMYHFGSLAVQGQYYL
jgi:hypothetical protein